MIHPPFMEVSPIDYKLNEEAISKSAMDTMSKNCILKEHLISTKRNGK